jgi:hypothetical protein
MITQNYEHEEAELFKNKSDLNFKRETNAYEGDKYDKKRRK